MNEGFVCAVSMLPVPKAAGLASERVDGKHCVWCGGAPSMELGVRLSVIDGTLKRWEPRSCQSCARREAGRVYDVHIRACARCSHGDYCPDARALYALALRRQTTS
ncbi:hypothetical protein [Streptomyces sp. NBC_01235]|uniref:hypothetical protein n=1 Tax=Streptomyces sp. NBC_01235 TaxID=2903788 RepID=UPI002E10143B|nr:hypothetical protein OG289_42150 [Streptomyces sp. NBC_01235]